MPASAWTSFWVPYMSMSSSIVSAMCVSFCDGTGACRSDVHHGAEGKRSCNSAREAASVVRLAGRLLEALASVGTAQLDRRCLRVEDRVAWALLDE